jgi:hypothetical protein
MLEVLKNEVRMTRGDTAIFDLEITDPAGEPYELQDGDVVRFTIRKTPGSGDIFVSKTGGIEIIIDPADTAKIPFGRYCYDVELTKADGTVDTIIPPTKFEICEEVTY